MTTGYICNKCAKFGTETPAAKVIQLKPLTLLAKVVPVETNDICEQCYQKFMEWLDAE